MNQNTCQFNFIVGTAAELIKVYPLIRLAIERGQDVRILSTSQSRENFEMQYSDFQLPQNRLTNLMESTSDLKKATSALKWFFRALLVNQKLFRAKLLLDSARPAYVIVHGDTLSTFVGAWLAKRAGIPVVHVEAGLRSASLFNPFPEEIMRRLVSRMVSYHVAPDSTALGNLEKAHVRGLKISSGGNTLLDAVRLLGDKSQAPLEPFVLVNVHRFENLNSPQRWGIIVNTVLKAAEKYRVIFVAHPQTIYKLEQDDALRRALSASRIEVRQRMPFSEFIGLLKSSQYLISDGGSNQEECSYLGKPCLILREKTERIEGLNTCCLLSRFDTKLIDQFLNNPRFYERPPVLTEAAAPTELIYKTLIESARPF